MLKSGIINSFFHAGPMARVILLILLFFSFVSWAIIIHKLTFLRRMKEETKNFLQSYRKTGRLSELNTICSHHQESALARVIAAGCREYQSQKKFLKRSAWSEDNNFVLMPSEMIEPIGRSLERAISEEVMQLEKHLIFLATTGSAGPFIGLFGTVWGIMDAFLGMEAYRSPSIAAVAPGLADALVTTIAGLAAAIPAVIAYNYFVNRNRMITTEIENVCSEFVDRLKQFLSRKEYTIGKELSGQAIETDVAA